MKNFTCILLLIWLCQISFGQNTANDFILPYDGQFRPASNVGYFPPFAEVELANFAAGNESEAIPGAGIKAFRPALFEYFMEEYGYDFFVNNFNHYEAVGLEENTVIVGFPKEAHQDTSYYCPGIRSELFSNLYTPIWDNGENGTPVNDENYYALYLYKMVTTYKDHVKFWEIWNEPGFDNSGTHGYLDATEPGNWWTNNPSPCDNKFRAPIYHYIRLLRISYEVIHDLDPDAYVTLSGVGYPSFLDAVLRNTDNPEDGSITAEYPFGGGAYFDVIGFHSYPHHDGSLQEWDVDLQEFIYSRHSDAAAESLTNAQIDFQNVLDNYGYDNNIYPEKHWIITECNIPRKPIGNYVGGDEVQRNFMMKAYVESVKSNFLQLHAFKLAEDETYDLITDEFDAMGLYKKFDHSNLYFQELTESGLAFKTTSDLLFDKIYDPVRTSDLQMSATVNGAAFYDADGNYTYILWAKTTTDQSENASANYSFPAGLGIDDLFQRAWDFGQTADGLTVNSQNIALSGTPLFFTELLFDASSPTGCAPMSVDFQTHNLVGTYSYEWSFEGAVPSTATGLNATVTYSNPGDFDVRLEIRDTNGELVAAQTESINVEKNPTIDFSETVSGPIAVFNNIGGTSGDFFTWDFGDGSTSSEANPTHVYDMDGSYLVTLTVNNACGTANSSETITINAPDDPVPAQTANDAVTPYAGSFRPGSNLGIFGVQWNDEKLANLAAGNPNENIKGAGVRSLRPFLSEQFLEMWGYELRVPTFQHYQNVGLEDNTMIVGFPSSAHQEEMYYCQAYQSELFAGMYDDIWDNGENGTPVNDDNYFALYLYRTATLYKDYIKFWEIWNEPGFDHTGVKGFLTPGEPGNWWDNNPDPCDYKLRAPVYHMVRMLRISYEVIKSVDPDALITFSGIGFPSFLDAVLRNTDNPEDGTITANYPHGGGAYFDVIGFHAYPHFDGSLRIYDNDLGAFVYERHSDAAAQGILKAQDNFQNVLDNYGYDNNIYPEKHWVITECNIPRKPISGTFGGDETQVNYTIKAYVQSMISGILQLHMYQIAERETYEDATDEFETMGLYEKLNNVTPYNQVKNDEGVALKTTSDQLFRTTYDAAKTNEMTLPDDVGGAAFVDIDGNYTYVLWARTSIDNSEVADAVYSFPSNMGITELYHKAWDYSETNNAPLVDGMDIALTGTPVFLSETLTTPAPPVAFFTADAQYGCTSFSVSYTSNSEHAENYLWTFPGGTPATSTEANPVVVYNNPGTYNVSLEVSNALGNHLATEWDYITVEPGVSPSFGFEVNGYELTLNNTSSGAGGYTWNFGDGSNSAATNPGHTYTSSGDYTISLSMPSACGVMMVTENILIVDFFEADMVAACPPLAVNFTPVLSGVESYAWTFPGGEPSSSTEANPEVVYTAPGFYDVILEIANAEGTQTSTRVNYISVANAATPSFVANANGPAVSFSNTSINSNSYLWDFGDGNTTVGHNPTHTYTQNGDFTVSLTGTNNICGDYTTTEIITIAEMPVADFQTGANEGCGGFNMYFQDKSSFAESWFWTFEGGNPATSTEQNVVVTYDTPGTYNVALHVSNAYGEDEIIEYEYVHVDEMPFAGLTSSVSGNTVELFSFSSSLSADHFWDFGDGITSTEINPVHTYETPGVYNITLTLTNACGSSSLIANIATTPLADFSFETGATCVPLEVSFINQSLGDPVSFSWSFPGGTPSSSSMENPVVTYNTAGVYDVMLVVENGAGANEITQTEVISVGMTPAVSFNVFQDGSTVSFFNESIGGDSYLWDFGDGSTSTEANPEHTYASLASYVVTLSATNGCGTEIYTEELVVSNAPSAHFESNNTVGCAGFLASFFDLSGGTVTAWDWQFPGGTLSSSTEQNPQITYNNPGVYSVSLTVSSTFGNSSTTFENYITILPDLNADFSVALEGNVASFSGLEENVGNYNWDFGDGFSSSEASPDHSYTYSGEYTVTLTVDNICGTSSSSQTIAIVAPPDAFFTSDISSDCQEATVQFMALSSPDTETLSWSFPGGSPPFSSDQAPVVTYDQPGYYDVTLVASNAAGNTVYNLLKYVTVYDAPVADFSYETEFPYVIFTDLSLYGNTITWDFGDGWTNDQPITVHGYEGVGEYAVSLIVENDCGFDTTTQIINIEHLANESVLLNKNVNLFPNPNDGSFVLVVEDLNSSSLELQMVNILGQRVHSEVLDVKTGRLEKKFDFEFLPKGAYLLELVSGEKRRCLKVVLE